jgi:hypothetical protein
MYASSTNLDAVNGTSLSSVLTDNAIDILAFISVDNTTSANNLTHGWGNAISQQFGSSFVSNAALPAVIAPPFINTEFKHVSLSLNHGLYLVSGTTCFAVFAADVNVCTSHGTCVATDTCICKLGYVGSDCSLPLCFGQNASDASVCGGNGLCMMPDVCQCYKGFKGTQCSVPSYGFAYAAGDDTAGQLADRHVGNDQYENTPIYSGGLFNTHIVEVATTASGYFTLFRTISGTVLGVGANNYGKCSVSD